MLKLRDMKKINMIWTIAKTELQTLFYSPIAWLVLVVVAIQVGMGFVGEFGRILEYQDTGYNNTGFSLRLFGEQGIFRALKGNMYLYIPLLTMGLISRELSNGSIKLLYAAPVNNVQIVLGKYFGILIFDLLLICIPVLYVIFGACTIENFELGAVLAGLLGLFLLICTYSAVGLFMSTISSYQIVVVICTVTLLGVLQAVGTMWQDIEFIQELTYWLSMSNRTTELFRGLICSEDVLYFVLVSSFFVVLTILRLQAVRQKMNWGLAWIRYVGVFVITLLLGFLTTRPWFMSFYDATHTKSNTLTPVSQEILSKLDGGLTITAYNNILDSKNNSLTVPSFKTFDKYRFKQYWRFKPEIKLKYVYYYDQVGMDVNAPKIAASELREQMIQAAKYWKMDTNVFLRPEEIRQKENLSAEGNYFLRVIKRENGQKTVLRTFDDNFSIPSEKEISAALLRLAAKVPKVALLQGHGGRDYQNPGERGYSRFSGDIRCRDALINNGFDVTGVGLDRSIPEDVDILIISDLKSSLEAGEMENLKRYIESGKNLVVLGDVKRQEVMNPIVELFGVTFLPGQLVKTNSYATADLIVARARDDIRSSAPFFYPRMQVVLPGCVPLSYVSDKGYKVMPLFTCDSSWNELTTTNFIDDTVRCDESKGEKIQNYPAVLALSRQVDGKEQKILVLGDADCISNGELERWRTNIFSKNSWFVTSMFQWLSDGRAPLDVSRPRYQDDRILLAMDNLPLFKILFQWVIPGILLLAGLFIWIRRRGK